MMGHKVCFLFQNMANYPYIIPVTLSYLALCAFFNFFGVFLASKGANNSEFILGTVVQSVGKLNPIALRTATTL